MPARGGGTYPPEGYGPLEAPIPARGGRRRQTRPVPHECRPASSRAGTRATAAAASAGSRSCPRAPRRRGCDRPIPIRPVLESARRGTKPGAPSGTGDASRRRRSRSRRRLGCRPSPRTRSRAGRSGPSRDGWRNACSPPLRARAPLRREAAPGRPFSRRAARRSGPALIAAAEERNTLATGEPAHPEVPSARRIRAAAALLALRGDRRGIRTASRGRASSVRPATPRGHGAANAVANACSGVKRAAFGADTRERMPATIAPGTSAARTVTAAPFPTGSRAPVAEASRAFREGRRRPPLGCPTGRRRCRSARRAPDPAPRPLAGPSRNRPGPGPQRGPLTRAVATSSGGPPQTARPDHPSSRHRRGARPRRRARPADRRPWPSACRSRDRPGRRTGLERPRPLPPAGSAPTGPGRAPYRCRRPPSPVTRAGASPGPADNRLRRPLSPPRAPPSLRRPRPDELGTEPATPGPAGEAARFASTALGALAPRAPVPPPLLHSASLARRSVLGRPGGPNRHPLGRRAGAGPRPTVAHRTHRALAPARLAGGRTRRARAAHGQARHDPPALGSGRHGIDPRAGDGFRPLDRQRQRERGPKAPFPGAREIRSRRLSRRRPAPAWP